VLALARSAGARGCRWSKRMMMGMASIISISRLKEELPASRSFLRLA
jgi:hypothetical protein